MRKTIKSTIQVWEIPFESEWLQCQNNVIVLANFLAMLLALGNPCFHITLQDLHVLVQSFPGLSLSSQILDTKILLTTHMTLILHA